MSIDYLDYSTSEILELFKTAYYEQHGKPMIIGSDEFSASAAFAYVLGVLCGDMNHSSAQRFIDTATGEYLDAIAAVNGLVRPGPSRASAVFSLVRAGYSSATAPAGAIQLMDQGGHVFENLDPVFMTASTVKALLFCTEAGSKNNGIPAGSISIVEAGSEYVQAGTNTEATSGGGDGCGYSEEGDAEFRRYIELNRSAYIVGGSAAAYRAKAFDTDSRVIDVRVLKDGDTGYEKGKVKIYINYALDASSDLKSLINDRILAACSADDFKPVGDLVQVDTAEYVECVFGLNILVKYPLKFRNVAVNHYNSVMAAYRDYVASKFGIPVSESELARRFVTPDESGVYALGFEWRNKDAGLKFGDPSQVLVVKWDGESEVHSVEYYESWGMMDFIDTGE